MDPFHFTLNAKANYAAYLPLSSESSGVQQLCERSVEAITAVFLSLKKRPLIRYQKTSEISRKIAQDAGVRPSALRTRGWEDGSSCRTIFFCLAVSGNRR